MKRKAYIVAHAEIENGRVVVKSTGIYSSPPSALTLDLRREIAMTIHVFEAEDLGAALKIAEKYLQSVREYNKPLDLILKREGK